MVGTQAEDGEGARDVRRQGWSCVRARARERVPHTPVRSYARTHAHTHALCVCVCMCICLRLRMCVRARMAKLIIIRAGAEGLLRVRNWPR